MILVISIARNSALLGRIESNTTLATRLSTTTRLISLLQRGKKVRGELVRVDNIRLLFLKCSSTKNDKKEVSDQVQERITSYMRSDEVRSENYGDNLLFA